MFNFPDASAPGAAYSPGPGLPVYVWDGEKWVAQAGSGASGLYKAVTFSRDLTLASGAQAVTGVGFKPRLLQFQTSVVGGATWASFGQSDSVSNSCMELQMAGSVFAQATMAGIQRQDTSNYQSFVVASLNADGFTLTWTKVGAPTITAQLTATCYG
ncbi:hypothetical protein [Bradyrhizobium sp. SEMIA]|uniref:hypothetical protein n=1 Tax=Bradyrhizobium sp. SEMIA TaxID=2597515 RepID=UPI0018A6825B|nr:hypothetical protein [Bradyrhizobium sp. SEMIA]QOG23165.1 hypothetical protein FOM02_43875 [Bradyrhizobium sp. SEMIA]